MQSHSRSVSRKHLRQAAVELSNHEAANETPKQKTSRQDCRPKWRGNNDYTKAKRSWRQRREKRLDRPTKLRESDGKRMIQRLNEESGRQENVVLSTWRWCKQGWLRLSQTTDRWLRPRSSLLTVLDKFNFITIIQPVKIEKKIYFLEKKQGGHPTGWSAGNWFPQ